MKKMIALLLVLSTLFSLVACGGKQDDPAINNTVTVTIPTVPTEPATEPTKTPMHRQEWSKDKEVEPFDKTLARLGTPWESDVKLDIPVYYEEDLLFSSSRYFLTSDSSMLLTYRGEYFNSAMDQFFYYPTNALRMRTDGTSYFVYDTDTGYRFYGFVTDYFYLMGYPIVINKNKMLSYSDFKDIQVGDPIEKVEVIDDVTFLYKQQMVKWNTETFEIHTKKGDPIVSVHYLKDGILRIEYKMPEEPNIVVSNMTFYEDYVIKTADGKMTSHKVKDIDLPVA